ncbi:MAG: hypothetical protein ACTSRA_00435 [Promethearchaeota archaeon]|nr:MAG: hypothetical protein [Helarchaeota virus Nidhogg Meg22_1012]URC17423.1 MAG: hypothetical protein [Helarchaeota virus Nidhogg Meg22_1214]
MQDILNLKRKCKYIKTDRGPEPCPRKEEDITDATCIACLSNLNLIVLTDLKANTYNALETISNQIRKICGRLKNIESALYEK